MIVCHCAVVGEKHITAAAAAGATTLSQICASTGAGRDCGACVFSVRRLLCKDGGVEVVTDQFPTPAEAERAAS